jgi:hypothetical protein
VTRHLHGSCAHAPSGLACALLLVALAVPGGTGAARAADSAPVAPADTAACRPRGTSGDSTGAHSGAPDSLPGSLRVVATLGDGSNGGPRLLEPGAVAADAFGRVTVADAGAHKLLRYEADGRWIDQTGALGSDPGQLRRPVAVSPLGSLGVAVLDRENRRIVSYDLFGRLIGVLVDFASPELQDALGRADAVALAADRGGAFYVAEGDRDRVLVFDFSGRYLRALGGYGTAPGSFRGISALACTPRGELVVTERAGARLQHLDAGGRVVASWPLAVKGARARLPVAVDDSSRVAVADEATGKLWVFDASGRKWAEIAGLMSPRAIAFARDGSLLVAEAGAGRVRRFQLVARRDPPAGGD